MVSVILCPPAYALFSIGIAPCFFYSVLFRCIKMALVHDLAECTVGDITPHCGVSKEEKHRRERVRRGGGREEREEGGRKERGEGRRREEWKE